MVKIEHNRSKDLSRDEFLVRDGRDGFAFYLHDNLMRELEDYQVFDMIVHKINQGIRELDAVKKEPITKEAKHE